MEIKSKGKTSFCFDCVGIGYDSDMSDNSAVAPIRTPLTVIAFDVVGGALPERVAVFDDARKAFKSVRGGTVDIALVNLETVCARYKDLQPGQFESDDQIFARWIEAMDRTLPGLLYPNGRSYIHPEISLHRDGRRIVETIRKNSSTVFADPVLSDGMDGETATRLAAEGQMSLYAIPNGYTAIFNGNTAHSFPGALICGSKDRRLVCGAHLPSAGQAVFGRVRSCSY